MMLRGWPGGGVEPLIPRTQQIRREGLEGTWGVINDDRIGWRGQLGGVSTQKSPGHLEVPRGQGPSKGDESRTQEREGT